MRKFIFNLLVSSGSTKLHKVVGSVEMRVQRSGV